MSFISPQTLLYGEHQDEIDVLADIVMLIRGHRYEDAIRAAIARSDYLQQAQTPRLVPYDPRAEA